MMADSVNHPEHYTHPSGAECIEIAEHFSFNLGNVVKYVWRNGRKHDRIEDLRKAAWYLEREIMRLENDIDRRETSLDGQAIIDPIRTAWGSVNLIDSEGA